MHAGAYAELVIKLKQTKHIILRFEKPYMSTRSRLPALLQGKNVLRKEPMSKEVDEADVFTFNDKFSSKLFKIKIGTVSAQKEGELEKQETRHKVSGTHS